MNQLSTDPLRQVASILILASTDLREFPKMFTVLESFLREEPEDNFITTSFLQVPEVPLTLNSTATKHFKEKTSDFPHLYESGVLEGGLNFLYVLGQLLTVTALALESHEYKNDKLGAPKRKIFSLWGSHARMNARSLVDEYSGANLGRTKRFLIAKITATLNIFEKEIIPIIAEK